VSAFFLSIPLETRGEAKMNYPTASSGVSIREKSKALRRKRRGIQPKEIQ
jgi:hypothetical protein